MKPAKPIPASRRPDAVLHTLMTRLFTVVLKNEPRARNGSVAGLHDIRVSLRRLRTTVATFRPWIPPKKDWKSLERLLSRLCDDFGEARDIDVWLEILRDAKKQNKKKFPASTQWKTFERRLKERRTETAAAALNSKDFTQFKKRLSIYLAKPIPLRRRPMPTTEEMARCRMHKIQKKITERYRNIGNFSSHSSHELRRACRRMRYLCTLFAPYTPPIVTHVGKHITKAQAALGIVHDCDTALAQLKTIPNRETKECLRLFLQQRRDLHIKRFKREWKKFEAPTLQRRWHKYVNDTPHTLIPS